MKGQYFSICNELLKLPHFYIMPCRKRKQCYLYLVILVNCGSLFWHSGLPATSGRWQKKPPVELNTICLAKTASQSWGHPETPPVSPWGTPGVYLRLLPLGPGTPPGWHQWGLGVTPGVLQGDAGGVSGWLGGKTMSQADTGGVMGWHCRHHRVTLGVPWSDTRGSGGGTGVTAEGSQGDTWVTLVGSWVEHWVSPVVPHCDTRGFPWWHQGSLRVTPGWQQGYLGLTLVGSWDDTRTPPAGGSWGDPGVTPQQWLGTYSHQNLIHINLKYVSQLKHFVGLTSLCGKWFWIFCH